MSGRINTGQAYRFNAWAARVLAIVAAIEALCIALLAAAIVQLVPLKEIQPMLLIGGSRDDQVWRVEPFVRGARGFELIVEKLAEQYVVQRETIDLQTEPTRWQQVEWMSSSAVWNSFRNEMDARRNPQSPYRQAEEHGLGRRIVPIVAAMLGPRQIQVEFERRDYHRLSGEARTRSGEEISRRVFVATLSFELQEQVVRFEDRYQNPIGFTVVDYGYHEKAVR